MRAAPTLLETQRRFLAALYEDDAGPIAAIAGNGLQPEARLRIYRGSSSEIQTSALRTSYPAVLALVGDAFFDQTARGYRRVFPSRSGNLQAFGEQFPAYLTSLPTLHELPYLPDVARLEWLRQQAALAASAVPLLPKDIRFLAASPAGQPCITLQPSVRLLTSPYAVLTIWRYAMQPTPERLELPATGERVMVWRESDQVAIAALDAASFACAEALARRGTLDSAATCGRTQDANFDFAACIASLVERDLVVIISPTGS